MKKNERTIPEYKKEYEKLNRFVPYVESNDQIIKFINGLREEYRASVYGSKSNSIDEVAEIAKRFENLYLQRRKRNLYIGPPPGHRPNITLSRLFLLSMTKKNQ